MEPSRDWRIDYDSLPLTENDAGSDPLALLHRWLDDASVLDEPNAMAVASADDQGHPSVRMVLLKSWGPDGLVFFTNRASRKGRDFAVNPWAAAVFHWQPLHRQVRVEGPVTPIDDAEADAYFATRPRGAQVGAAASDQSAAIDSRRELERRAAAVPDGPVARPSDWGGFRIGLGSIEFWQGRPNRLHDRLLYRRADDGWERVRLQP